MAATENRKPSAWAVHQYLERPKALYTDLIAPMLQLGFVLFACGRLQHLHHFSIFLHTHALGWLLACRHHVFASTCFACQFACQFACGACVKESALEKPGTFWRAMFCRQEPYLHSNQVLQLAILWCSWYLSEKLRFFRKIRHSYRFVHVTAQLGPVITWNGLLWRVLFGICISRKKNILRRCGASG